MNKWGASLGTSKNPPISSYWFRGPGSQLNCRGWAGSYMFYTFHPWGYLILSLSKRVTPIMGVSQHFEKKLLGGEIGFDPYLASGHMKIHNTWDILTHFTQVNTHRNKIRPWEPRPQCQLTSHQPFEKRSRKTTKAKMGQLRTHKVMVLENGNTYPDRVFFIGCRTTFSRSLAINNDS